MIVNRATMQLLLYKVAAALAVGPFTPIAMTAGPPLLYKVSVATGSWVMGLLEGLLNAEAEAARNDRNCQNGYK